MHNHHHHGNNQGFEGGYDQNQGFNQGNQGFNQGFNQGNQGFNQGNQGFNQGNQGFNQGNQGFNQGVGDFVHLTGQNFGQHGASYAIQSALGKSLDVCQQQGHGNNAGDLIIYKFYGGKNQRFTINHDGQDLIIRSVQTGNVLEVVPGYHHQSHDPSEQQKGRIREMPFTGHANQRWRIRRADNNHNQYFIMNVGNHHCLDVEGDNNSNNNPVITFPFNGGKNQMWSIVAAPPGLDHLPHQGWW